MLTQTDRLTIRKFSLNDTVFIQQLLNSEGWLKYIGDRQIDSEEAARNYLQRVALDNYEKNRWGIFLIERMDDQVPVGLLSLLKRDYLPLHDIGFALLPAYSGRGYAYEAASKLMTYAKNDLGIPAVCAITLEHNLRSIALLKKLGLSFVKRLQIAEDPEELLLYQE